MMDVMTIEISVQVFCSHLLGFREGVVFFCKLNKALTIHLCIFGQWGFVHQGDQLLV